jgi:hypothetical protein
MPIRGNFRRKRDGVSDGFNSKHIKTVAAMVGWGSDLGHVN